MLTSCVCKSCHFDSPWFIHWRDRFRFCTANGVSLGGDFRHRKEWEYVLTAQALLEGGSLKPGRVGLGFAVGAEPLPALFASLGCRILATDYPNDHGGTWGGMWASGKSSLRYPLVCDPEVFEANVTFECLDMCSIPKSFANFDFAWSCCAVEHLGDLEAGISFLIRQMDCLKPGGVAVHSLEFNVSSNENTIDSGHTVLYRRRDIEALKARLDSLGHELLLPDFSLGSSLEDASPAVRPFHDMSKNLAHLRIRLGPFVTTSMVLIFRKALS